MSKEVIMEKLIIDNKKNAIRLSDVDRKVISKNNIRGKDLKDLKIKKLIEANKKNALELTIVNKLVSTQKKELKKREIELMDLVIADKEFVIQNKENKKLAAKLVIANKELTFQNQEKEKRAAELVIANKELALQNQEKEKRAAELVIANKELAFQNKENEKRAEELIKASEKLEQLLQLNSDKDLFISILAHDLRSPFNALLGLSELLLENMHIFNIDEIEECIININKSAHSTFTLLEDLLKWARMQSGKIPFNPQKFNFSEICKDFIEIFKPSADLKNITFNCLIVEQTSILADVDMFKAILRNIFSNAIKFTNRGGQIDIHSKINQKDVTISVSDTGIGITPGNLKKLFDISQIRTTKGTDEEIGSGLGLVLCKEFVEKNGGKIWVESEYGKGSKFIFTMPKYI